MSYFKDMIKDTRVFGVLVFLAMLVSLPISWMLQEMFNAGLMLSFISSYTLGVIIVFSAFFIYAVRKENMIENGD
ncbi:MAG TPA: hypothetical protein ENK66_01935 [Arcobacter sp.]|nr:hypothetical protein [Arcobacter sp.]